MICPIPLKTGPPSVLTRLALVNCIPRCVNLIRYHKRWVGPVDIFPNQCDLFITQRRAVCRFGATLIGRTPSDYGTTTDQRRPGWPGTGSVNSTGDGLGIVSVNTVDHLPAVGAKSRWGVGGKPGFDFPVDRNTVVIPERNQLTQTQSTGQRTSLVGDSLHQTAVTHKHISKMVHDIVTGLIELASKHFFT